MRLLRMCIIFGIALSTAPLLRAETGVTVPRADFIAGMQNALPTALCTDQSYFRTCFRVSQKECEATAPCPPRRSASKTSRTRCRRN